jgi:hypothetical protein
VLLDPTGEKRPVEAVRAPRRSSLAGCTVGLLDINKLRCDVFLDRVAELFDEQGVQVRRYKKPSFSRPAPLELRQRIQSECQAVVEALAD